jgi:hypothetical protein
MATNWIAVRGLIPCVLIIPIMNGPTDLREIIIYHYTNRGDESSNVVTESTTQASDL